MDELTRLRNSVAEAEHVERDARSRWAATRTAEDEHALAKAQQAAKAARETLEDAQREQAQIDATRTQIATEAAQASRAWSPRSGDPIDPQTLRQAGADYAHAARTGDLRGAGAELNTEYGIPAADPSAPGVQDGPGVLVPMAVADAMAAQALAQRASSTMANLPSRVTVAPVRLPLVPQMALDFLGVRPTSTPWGTLRERYLSDWPTAAFKAENAAAADEAAVVRSKDFTPTRLEAVVSISQEAAYTNDPNIGSDIMGWCRMSVNIESDEAVIAGDATAPNPRGLVNPATAPTAADTALTYATALDLGAQVDGKRAATAADVRLLVNPTTYNRLMVLRGTGNAADMSALQALADMGIQVRASAHIPERATISSNTNNSKVLTRLGTDPADYVFVEWDAMRVAELSTSLATLGKRVFAAHAFIAFDGFPAANTGRSGGFPVVYVKES